MVPNFKIEFQKVSQSLNKNSAQKTKKIKLLYRVSCQTLGKAVFTECLDS